MLALVFFSLGLLATATFLFAGARWPPLAIFATGLLSGAFLMAALWALVRSQRGAADGPDRGPGSRHPHPYERGRWSY